MDQPAAPGVRLHNTIHDLAPNTEYRWAVRAENGDGASAWVHGPNFTTRPSQEDDSSDVSPAPTNLRFDTPTDSSCTVRWDAVEGATDYDVNYKPASGGRWTNEPHRGASLYNTIHDLASNTEYRWAVRAENRDGPSQWVFGPNFTTADEPAPIWTARTDSLALVALYASTNGADWHKKDNWLSNESMGLWHGVVLDTTGRVAALYLENNDLSGPIPPELGQLDQLIHLFLHMNDLTGPIPPELGALSKLEHLSLYLNKLSGDIPPQLGDLENLDWLSLYDNSLTGRIPPELGNLRRLRYLQLSSNQFNSSIPYELTNLTKLRELFLGETLYGCIPPALLRVRIHDLGHRDLPLCQ